MTDLFFYGTLRHEPLLRVVLGHSDAQVQPAGLSGFAALGITGEDFPTIEERAGDATLGLLVRGLSEEDVDRIRFYEGEFVYDLKTFFVTTEGEETVPAQVLFPQAGLWQGEGKWSLPDWEKNWASIAVSAAREAMAWYGRLTSRELAERFPAIRLHAAARIAAATRPADCSRDLQRDVVVHKRDWSFLQFHAVEEADLQFRRNDGSLTPVLNRTGMMVGEASVVLPYDPVRDVVLLVEQFRAPVFLAGDPSPWVWEPVAGLIDPGETPEEAAYREVREEAGMDLRRLEPAGAAYSSTGSSGEYLHFFIGIGDIPEVAKAGGMAEEHEDILAKIVSYDDLMRDVDAGNVQDIPLMTVALWLARHRDRLREVV